MKQQQFLEVIDRDEAERRWREVLDAGPLPPESVGLSEALGRVLAEDVRAGVADLIQLLSTYNPRATVATREP